MEFLGKRVLITGGAGYLGLATAKSFDAAGATVIILDNNDAKLEEAKKLLPNASTVSVDLFDWEATRNKVKEVGRVDHLVNNAAIFQSQEFMEATAETIDTVFGVNFKAVVNVSQVVAEEMLSSGVGGTIVNISSIGGKVTFPKISIYGASKAAVCMLTKSMAVELSPNIRVNAVCPASLATPLTLDYIEQNPEQMKKYFERALTNRHIEPEEVADLIIFLSSSASTMINGTSVDIDSGYSAG